MATTDNFDQWSITTRPQTVNDLYGCQAVKDYIKNGAKKDSWHRAILLTGKFGTGKTTAAHIIAMTMVCKHLDENGNPCLQCPDCQSVLNGKFNRDIKQQGAEMFNKDSGTIKDDVKQYVQKAMEAPFFGSKRKVIIFDEVQELLASKNAINSFLTILEKQDSKTYWIFTSMEKLPEGGFLSRIPRFNFVEMANNDIVRYLFNLSKRIQYEGMSLWEWCLTYAGNTPDERKNFVTQGFLQIAKCSCGSLRNATNNLQTCIETRTFDVRKIATRFGSFVEDDVMDAFYALAQNKKNDILIDTLAQIDSSNQQQFVFFAASYIKDAEIARTFGKLKAMKTVKNKETGEEESVLTDCVEGDWRYDKAIELCRAPNYEKLRTIITKYCGIGYICKDLMIAELLSVLS